MPRRLPRSARWECFAGPSFTDQQLDALRPLRQEVRRELLAESKKHPATKLLCQIPAIGPIRAALLIALIQTPHRFRSKRPLWKYSGFGIEMHSSADYRKVQGQLERTKKQPQFVDSIETAITI